ncbi:glycosyltransferase involved in cell wall biosynthesis [Salinibacter ruber]|uniref:glycosyltransferase n=1 Tax=Salinibacter ruber TaxID=146919 RepID=UPI0021696A60|nr:glycosyltransferase [Salinibacter ruber]MCS3827476.1 glycosyltransferase involved in cell wall biosynthesis [Salinibacter ruber]
MADTVSLFVNDLGGNPIARVLPIAKAFQKADYEVEILGFLFEGDEELHSSYLAEVEPLAIQTSLHPAELFPNVRRLAHAASGDIVYAFKPIMTTLAPALYAARIVEDRPLLLDVEDEEVYGDQSWSLEATWRKLFRGWRLGTSWKYTRLLQLFRRSVDAVTVVSTKLQRRYGGTLLRHGPDEEEFHPDRKFNANGSVRKKWGLPEARKLAVFTGTPRSHKGLDTLSQALSRPECREWDFVLVGPNENEYARSVKEKLPRRSHFLGAQPYGQVPELLSVADAVPIPQKKTSFAEAQVPAKLLDAMAMARPIVASRVGDLPKILGDGKRGWLMEPGDPASLAQSLSDISQHPKGAATRARRARQWYGTHASTTAIEEKLSAILKRVR